MYILWATINIIQYCWYRGIFLELYNNIMYFRHYSSVKTTTKYVSHTDCSSSIWSIGIPINVFVRGPISKPRRNYGGREWTMRYVTEIGKKTCYFVFTVSYIRVIASGTLWCTNTNGNSERIKMQECAFFFVRSKKVNRSKKPTNAQKPSDITLQ